MGVKIKVVILIIITLISSGCWDRSELSQMLIVSGAAFDKKDDGKIVFTISAIRPKSSNLNINEEKTSMETKMVLISEEGTSVSDVYNKMEMKLSRRIFLSHMEGIIIGENLAREGLNEVIEFVSRYREPPIRIYILFSKGEASEVIKKYSLLGENILSQIKKLQGFNIGIKTLIKDFINELSGDGIEPFAPLVQIVQSESSKSEEIIINGAAVFKKDKLSDYINNNDAIGVLWIRNKIKGGMITINIPQERGGGKIGGEVIRSKTKIRPAIKDNKVEISIEIQTEVSINETTSNLDLSEPRKLHYLEACYENNIKNIIKESLEKFQKELKLDVFGFGLMVHGKYPKQWKDYYNKSWDEEFSKVNVSVNCSVKIYETGFNTKPLIKEE